MRPCRCVQERASNGAWHPAPGRHPRGDPIPPCAGARGSAVLLALSIARVLTAPRALRHPVLAATHHATDCAIGCSVPPGFSVGTPALQWRSSIKCCSADAVEELEQGFRPELTAQISTSLCLDKGKSKGICAWISAQLAPCGDFFYGMATNGLMSTVIGDHQRDHRTCAGLKYLFVARQRRMQTGRPRGEASSEVLVRTLRDWTAD